MNVFEAVTDELRSVHNENDLKNLEEVAENYYRANLENTGRTFIQRGYENGI